MEVRGEIPYVLPSTSRLMSQDFMSHESIYLLVYLKFNYINDTILIINREIYLSLKWLLKTLRVMSDVNYIDFIHL